MDDPFFKIAKDTHFNIYHSPLWNGTARRFAEAIVKHCSALCGSQADRSNILRAFDLSVENTVKYQSPEPIWSVESQYQRSLNLPKNKEDRNEDTR